MRSVLIVMKNTSICHSIMDEMKGTYNVTFCSELNQIEKLLHQNYDALMIDLLFNDMDGLSILEKHKNHLPPIVLVLAPLITQYMIQAVETMAFSYILRMPCPIEQIHIRLDDMFLKYETQEVIPERDPVRYHLRRLGFNLEWKGSQYLIRVLSHYDQKSTTVLSKNCYQPIADEECVTVDAIDNGIRGTIHRAYEKRNPAIWDSYFPDLTECPKNRSFISALSEYLSE